MKNKVYYLAIFWGAYNDKDDEPNVLMEFNTQKELDDFTKKFHSDDELRAFFDQEIGELALDNIDKIRKNETKHGKFLGRISAYYMDEKGKLNFIKVAYHYRKVVRDYHELKTLKERMKFFGLLFDELVKRLFKKPKDDEKKQRHLPTNEKMFVIIQTFSKYHYYISDNEKYYLKIYLENPSSENKNKFFDFMKINLNDEIEKEKEYQKSIDDCYNEEKEEKYVVYDNASPEFARIFNIAVKNGDFNDLFKYFTIGEIMANSNYYDIQGQKRR